MTQDGSLARLSSLSTGGLGIAPVSPAYGGQQGNDLSNTQQPPQQQAQQSMARMTGLGGLGRLSNLSQGIGRFTGLGAGDLGRMSGLNFSNLGNFSGFPTGSVDLSNPTTSPSSHDMSKNSLNNIQGNGTPPPPIGVKQPDSSPQHAREQPKASTPTPVTTPKDGSKQPVDQDGSKLPPRQQRPRPKFIIGLNSLDLFMSFVQEFPDPNDPAQTLIDSSEILSLECYESWINTRRSTLKKPEESFRRALTAHVTGADRRRPFPPRIETSLLIELRKQKTWPCFEGRVSKNENKPIKIGEQGFRTMGYHEKKAFEAAESSQKSSTGTPPFNEFKQESPVHLHQGHHPQLSPSHQNYQQQLQQQQQLHMQMQQQIQQQHPQQMQQHSPVQDQGSGAARPSILRRLSSSLTSILPSALLQTMQNNNNNGMQNESNNPSSEGQQTWQNQYGNLQPNLVSQSGELSKRKREDGLDDGPGAKRALQPV